jgi:DeoR family fructose operon transcriptional repressor
MHHIERYEIILEKLKLNGKVTVNELADQTGVSAMTIRRDLQRLEDQGLLQKVHGAAVPSESTAKERAFSEKQTIQLLEKRMIAQVAIKLVKPGDTILMDAGTTVYEMAKMLKDIPGITVLTNDLHIAMELSSTNVKLYYIGGEIEKDLGRSSGIKAFQFLEDIHVDTAFIGVTAINKDMLLCSYSMENAKLKLAMMNCADRKVLLADKSKFETNAFAQFGPLSQMNVLITDKKLDDQERSYLEQHEIELYQTEPVG